MGRTPSSFIVILLLSILQLGLAFLLADQPWWLLIAVAYGIGALANHALWVMVHECSHRLIFRRSAANRIAGIIANIPQVIPSTIEFEKCHVKHHAFQGVYDFDGDVPSRWEAKLLGNSVVGKALWLTFYPVVQTLRLRRLKGGRELAGWLAANWIVQAAFTVLLLALLGPKALAYLLCSVVFSIGLHPLGGRWIQEHSLVVPGQETYSYYGILNVFACNIGYHAEHHDLPSIPWSRLPKLRRMAPEFYSSLVSYRSWTWLWLRFLFDKECNLFAMTVRNEVVPARAGRVAGAQPTSLGSPPAACPIAASSIGETGAMSPATAPPS